MKKKLKSNQRKNKNQILQLILLIIIFVVAALLISIIVPLCTAQLSSLFNGNLSSSTLDQNETAKTILKINYVKN